MYECAVKTKDADWSAMSRIYGSQNAVRAFIWRLDMRFRRIMKITVTWNLNHPV